MSRGIAAPVSLSRGSQLCTKAVESDSGFAKQTSSRHELSDESAASKRIRLFLDRLSLKLLQTVIFPSPLCSRTQLKRV